MTQNNVITATFLSIAELLLTSSEIKNYVVHSFPSLSFLSVSDFTHELSKIHEQHSDDLQNLVAAFRQKNAELRNDRYERTND